MSSFFLRFVQFQDTLTKSNGVFEIYKSELDKARENLKKSGACFILSTLANKIDTAGPSLQNLMVFAVVHVTSPSTAFGFISPDI